MNKHEIFVSNLKSAYLRIKTNLKVVIAGLTVLASSVVAHAASMPPDFTSEPISIVNTYIVDDSAIPQNYISTLLPEKIHIQDATTKWLKELDEIAKIEENWDGEGASAVQSGAVKNCRLIIDFTIKAINKLEEIYPTPFGSLCMEWTLTNGYLNAEVSMNGIGFFRKYTNGESNINFEFAPLDDKALTELSNLLS